MGAFDVACARIHGLMGTPPPDEPPSWLASPPPASPPAPVAVAPEIVTQPEAEPAQPWNMPVPASPSRSLIYLAGFLIIVLIGALGLGVYNVIHANDTSGSLAHVTPSPLIPAYERADRFLNVDLAPSLTETNQALPAVTSNCTASLPSGCKDALITLDKAMVDVDTAISANQGDIPACIGPQMQQFRDDWSGMEQGVAMAISGYQSSSRTLIIQGLQKFAAIAHFLKPDIARINSAEQGCAKTV